MKTQVPLFHVDIAPGFLNELLLVDHFAWALGELYQNLERAAAHRYRRAVSLDQSLRRKEREGAEENNLAALGPEL